MPLVRALLLWFSFVAVGLGASADRDVDQALVADLAVPTTDFVAAERARFDAMVAGDLEKLDRMFGDDLVYTHSDGRVETKEQLLTALRSGRVAYETITPADTKARLFGEVGVITGRVSIGVRAGEQRRSFNARYTAVYHLRDGRWTLVSWQTTRLPEN